MRNTKKIQKSLWFGLNCVSKKITPRSRLFHADYVDRRTDFTTWTWCWSSSWFVFLTTRKRRESAPCLVVEHQGRGWLELSELTKRLWVAVLPYCALRPAKMIDNTVVFIGWRTSSWTLRLASGDSFCWLKFLSTNHFGVVRWEPGKRSKHIWIQI